MHPVPFLLMKLTHYVRDEAQSQNMRLPDELNQNYSCKWMV